MIGFLLFERLMVNFSYYSYSDFDGEDVSGGYRSV